MPSKNAADSQEALQLEAGEAHAEAASPSAQSETIADRRGAHRDPLRIPFRLRFQDTEVSGVSQDISPTGISILSDTALGVGTPLTLQCSFAETCYLDLSAQVAYCRRMEGDASPLYTIGVRLAALRDWEQKIILSAVESLRENPSGREKSLLTLLVSKDAVALEAAKLYTQAKRPRADRLHTARRSCVHASKIIGWGAYLPPNMITNGHVNAMLARNGEKTKFGDVVGALTGIQARHYAGSRTYPSDLAVEASARALKSAGVDPKDLEVIISCGVSRDVEEPATACIIQEKLGATNAYVFDLANACNGFVSGIDVLDSFIASGRYEVGLVTAGEVISQFINWEPETKGDLRLSSMGYTLGDGGGAAVLTRTKNGEQRGIKARWFLTDSSYWEVAVVPLMENSSSKRLFRSNGVEIERAALQHVPIGVEETMRMLDWDISDIELIVPHQVSHHIIDNLFHKRLGMPQEKIFWSYPRHGNVGAASMPVALCTALSENRLKIGDKILLVGGSGGFGVGIMGLIL
ncbi:MAG: 3-oxoacyl-[acyl-carrier-protein] synthase III C-terminal domain-containing protein [Nitrospirota bacterium]